MRCVVHPGVALLSYFVAVFLGGALGAPWLYRGTQGAAEMIPALNPEQTMGDLGVRLLKAAQTAALVGVIGERLFRGALFGVLRKSWS